MKSFIINFDALKTASERVKKSLKGQARPIAQAGADVVYEQVRSNVAALPANTGNLYKSIYQVYSERRSTADRAVYAVSYRTGWGVKADRKGGGTIAPHGHLLEYGWVQRYQVYIDKNGNFKTAIRPENYGKKPPRRRASQAEKDAFYMPRPGGPVQWVAKPFMRPAIDSSKQAAIDAMRKKTVELLKAALAGERTPNEPRD